jgi:hypothetical protein
MGLLFSLQCGLRRHGGIADLNVDNSSNSNVQWISHSLAEMLSFLPPPPPVISADGVTTSYSPWAVWVNGSYFSTTMVADLTDPNVADPNHRFWASGLPTVYGNGGFISFSLPANQPPSQCNAGASPCTISLTLRDLATGRSSASEHLVMPATYNVVDVPGSGQFNTKWQSSTVPRPVSSAIQSRTGLR